MTIKERVHSVEETGWDSPAVDMDHPDKPATTEKMILLAYEIGREEATKEVSDAYTDLLRKIRERADNCRYHHMARGIVGDTKYIYHPDYAGCVTEEFGDDRADV